MSKTFYDFKATSLKGEEIEMSRYKGKVVLIVNTASECGLTPQYEGLQELYETYKDKGLEILGFPCNQFGGQEPGTEVEIAEGCLVNYGVSFQMFAKIDVNGEHEHPLYTFLKEQKSELLGRKIKWNFAKFLIDREGNVVDRFAPTTTPKKTIKYIEKYL